MGMVFYPCRSGQDEPWAMVDVSDPGTGRLTLMRLDDRFALLEAPDPDPGVYAGPALGALVDAVTLLAVGREGPGQVTGPMGRYVTVQASQGQSASVARDEAGSLLPVLGRAVVFAAAGQDRGDRLWPDPDSEPPGPLCVSCNLGSHDAKAVTISEWCADGAHRPFGMGPDDSWDLAQRLHRAAVRLWRIGR